MTSSQHISSNSIVESTMQEPQPKRQKKDRGPAIEKISIKNPDWSYAHLKMIYDPPFPPSTVNPSYPPDILTWRTALTSSLTQFLGLTGSAIHIDILHLEHDEAWLRLPRSDISMFGAAVSGYVGLMEDKTVGFRTIGVGDFLMSIVGKGDENDVWAWEDLN